MTTTDKPPQSFETVVPLLAENVTIDKRTVESGGVRVHVRTSSRDLSVDEILAREHVEIQRVPVNLIVDAAPPVREEGDTTIISIVEEVVVVERRLMLKEEIRIRRVQSSDSYHETIVLREQQALIERIAAPELAKHDDALPARTFSTSINPGITPMDEQTIVAIYDTPAHAAIAVQDLEESGIPSSAITQHARAGTAAGSSGYTEAPAREQGFWSSLFGADPESEHDTHVYDRSLASGSTVVTVKVPESHISEVTNILESHGPVDIDERASTYGLVQGSALATNPTPMPASRAGTTGEEVIQLSEETLAVGKRAVNRGTTRVRRYVIETPVEEQISLRDETVSVERPGGVTGNSDSSKPSAAARFCSNGIGSLP